MCKRSADAPHCDGAHRHLKEDSIDRSPSGPEDTIAPVAPTPEEPGVQRIHELARHGLERAGRHGELVPMGVPRPALPQWDDIQILTAQLASRPLLDDEPVGSELVIGPGAAGAT